MERHYCSTFDGQMVKYQNSNFAFNIGMAAIQNLVQQMHQLNKRYVLLWSSSFAGFDMHIPNPY